MPSFNHISCNFFESRVRLTKSEEPHIKGKEGIREYTNPFICFFAVLFGFAVNVAYKGQMFCLNKNSFYEWVKRNLKEAPQFDAIVNHGTDLIVQVKQHHSFPFLKKEIEQLDDLPEFVKKLCQNPPTAELHRELKVWRKARDVMTVWKALNKLIDVDIPDLVGLDSISSCLNVAKEFAAWVEIHKFKLEKCSYLNLSKSQLKELPKEIGTLNGLIGLNLSENFLKKIPREIGKLKSLAMKLDLSGNQLEKLPQEIAELTHLGELSLSGNKLKELPVELFKLKNLWKLNLSGNELGVLPNEIGALKNLKWLNLSGNKLSALPKEIGELKHLEWLGLLENKLQWLPKEICQQKSLIMLLLSGNQLKVLPKEMIQLINLEKLLLKDNPDFVFPSEIVTKLKEHGVNVSLN